MKKNEHKLSEKRVAAYALGIFLGVIIFAMIWKLLLVLSAVVLVYGLYTMNARKKQ